MSNDKRNGGILGSDDRIKKSAAEDVRGLRSEQEDASREQTDGTVLSREERLRAFRDEFTNEALPSPPSKAGWHYCWLTTTNPMDPIHRRIRMGYQLVRAEELPGFDTYRMKSGTYEGLVGVNEMLLAKLPNDLYQEMMQWLHFDSPNEEEEKLRALKQNLEGVNAGRDKPIIEVDMGLDYGERSPVGAKPRVPTFTD